MADLPESFGTALSNIEPQREKPKDDAANAAAAHAEVSDVLKRDATLKRWGISPVLIGSYARSVSIRRVKDVDVFCRLESPPEDLRPGKALDEFERVLLAECADRCERQHRSFKIEFPDFDLSVDAVPARLGADDVWEIPSRPGECAQWIQTAPLTLNDITMEMNKRFVLGSGGVYVPVVKLMRQVRRSVLGAGSQPGGLFLELMTYWAFDLEMTTQSSMAAYLAETLKHVAAAFPDVLSDGLDDPTLEGKKISTKATDEELEEAAERFADAADLADRALMEKDTCKSAVLWAELLGENCDGPVFELPSFCNADGSTRGALLAGAAERTAGADRVPAGEGRYA